MRRPRLKLDSSKEDAYYHCISRTVGAEWLLEADEKEILRKQMWTIAEYCGVEVITYALMSNHYHVLVKVPQRRPVSDEELIRLYCKLNSGLTLQQERRLGVIKKAMEQDEEAAQKWRERQLRQMFDVSQFNKLLKMRFSIWYNKKHKRIGTLWAERFKSVLVENGQALKTIAAYIDLNCVRGGIVDDPKDYRFCGYGEAIAGGKCARAGVALVHSGGWEAAAQAHRCLMFGSLGAVRENRMRPRPELLEQVIKDQGVLSMPVVLQCRVRYFSDGAILGGKEFVRAKAESLRSSRQNEPRALKPVTDWKGLCVLSRMRGRLWGSAV